MALNCPKAVPTAGLLLVPAKVSLPDEAIDVSIRFGDLPDSHLIAKKPHPTGARCAHRPLICAMPANQPILTT